MSDRILIIDDNEAIHDDYRKLLQSKPIDSGLDELEALLLGGKPIENCQTNVRHSIKISSAFHGEEGLVLVQEAIANNDPFAVAFVDMRMPPGWDGLETIEHIWKVDPDIQVVICTAYSDHSWDEIAKRFPNEHRLLLLKKPFDIIEVCQLASSLMQKWRAERNTKYALHNLEDAVEARTSELRHELDERRRMEAALRASESEFAAIFKTASDGIVIIDEDATIVRCNSAVRKMTGKSAEELAGSSFVSLLGEVKDCPPEKIFLDLLEKVDCRSAQELELKGDGQHVVPVLVSTSEFFSGGQRRFTVTLRDMTEQKQMQRELNQAQKLESIGQLAAGIAHEINTPMQCVSGNVEFLRSCYNRLFEVLDRYQEYLNGPELSWQERKEMMDRLNSECRYDHIRQQAPPAIEEAAEAVTKVIEIVRAMKAMSHPGTEEKVVTDVNQLIRSASTISRNRWKYTADLEFDLEESLPEVLALSAEINQVLLNLIVNAADAVVEKVGQDSAIRGKIIVRTRSAKDGVIIEVQDTGCGMTNEVKQKIFDPFFTTKDVGKGTGQGLAITYDAVVNKHGGQIFVDTILGEGSTFSVWLPLEPESRSRAKANGEEFAAAELAVSN
jgi:PAS domain S-box-containing protein